MFVYIVLRLQQWLAACFGHSLEATVTLFSDGTNQLPVGLQGGLSPIAMKGGHQQPSLALMAIAAQQNQ